MGPFTQYLHSLIFISASFPLCFSSLFLSSFFHLLTISVPFCCSFICSILHFVNLSFCQSFSFFFLFLCYFGPSIPGSNFPFYFDCSSNYFLFPYTCLFFLLFFLFFLISLLFVFYFIRTFSVCIYFPFLLWFYIFFCVFLFFLLFFSRVPISVSLCSCKVLFPRDLYP